MEEQPKKRPIGIIKSLGIGIILVLFIRSFFFSNYIVEGESMMPTLQEGNLLMVNKIGFHIGQLKRFDIVVFHANEKEDFVKRIVGLPGDKLEYKDDILYINGEPVEEPFLGPYKQKLIGGNLTGDFQLEEITGEKVVPEGYLFVIGDNRLGSLDSRHFGFISIDQVVGKVNFKYWPVEDIDLLF